MGDLSKQYEALGRAQGIGPSGQRYEWHTPTGNEHAAVFGGIPGLLNSAAKGSSGTPDDDTFHKSLQLNQDLVVQCVDYPKIVDDRVDQTAPADGDWLPVTKMLQVDLSWLVERILSGRKLDSPEADLNRRAL